MCLTPHRRHPTDVCIWVNLYDKNSTWWRSWPKNYVSERRVGTINGRATQYQNGRKLEKEAIEWVPNSLRDVSNKMRGMSRPYFHGYLARVLFCKNLVEDKGCSHGEAKRYLYFYLKDYFEAYPCRPSSFHPRREEV